MGLGQVVLGLASVALGVHHLNKGVNQLRASGRRGLGSLLSDKSRPFHDSGRVPIRMPNGQNVPARMRSYRIGSLEDRIRHLRDRVDADKRNPEIYAFVRRATSKKCNGDQWCIDEKDNLSEARAIFAEIRKNVRYTSDIAGVDTYQNPSRTLALRSGDCDDYSTLACAALLSAGIPCRFKVIRTKGANDWNHIYAQAGFPRQSPRRWVSMDASVSKPFGWEAPATMVVDSRVFPVR